MHYMLFPQCFQKACFPEASKGVIVWEWVKQARLQEGLMAAKNSVSGHTCTPYTVHAVHAFPTVFSKGLFPRSVKRCHCVGMG